MQTILLSGPTSGFMFREILETLFRLRRRLILLVLVIVALGITLAVLAHPKYHAQSSVLVLPGPEYTVRTIAGTNQSVNQSIDRTYILATEVAILSSRDLHREVLQSVGLGEVYPIYLQPPGLVTQAMKAVKTLPGVIRHDLFGTPIPPPSGPHVDPLELALNEFSDDFTATASAESNTIALSYANKDPVVAAKVLSTLEKLYMERRKTLFADAQASSVQQEAQKLHTKLIDAERELADFKVAHDISNFSARQDILLQEQGNLEKSLMEAQSSADQQRARVAELQVSLTKTPRQITGQDADVDSRTTALRSNLDALLTKRADLASRYQAGSAPAQVLDAQIAARQADLARTRGDRSASGFHTTENPVFTDTNLQLMHAQADYRAAQAAAQRVSTQVDEILDQQKAMNSLSHQLDVLTRQQKQASEDYADAAKILTERRIIEQVTSNNQAGVRILSEVVEPLLPAATRKLIVILAAGLAVMLAVLIVLLTNYFRRGFLLAGAFEKECGIPVLVVIPEMPSISGGGRLGAIRPV